MTPMDLGHAAVLLWQSRQKQASDASISYGLKGKLQLSSSGWLLLVVPNDLGIGAFKALNAQGAEMPFSSSTGRYNAHISVMRPEEVEQIGAERINERGKEFGFTLGPVREVEPAGWAEMDRCWFIECRSPELEKLRKSYGLSALPKNGDYKFHITFAVRRRKVLRPGDTIKKMPRGSIIHRPSEFMKAAVNRNQDSREQVKVASNNGVEIKESAIDGKGLFATRDFEPGEVVVARAMAKLPGEDGLTNYEQSDESRFTNHSDNPNITLVKQGDYIAFIAAGPITAGEELTGDYNAVSGVLGPGFYFTHRGKPYDGESSSGRAPEDDSYLLTEGDAESDDGIAETLRAMWAPGYDPIHGSRGTGSGDRPRGVGDSAEGTPAPGLDGDDAGMPGSLHADTGDHTGIDAARHKTGSVHRAEKGAAHTRVVRLLAGATGTGPGGEFLQSAAWRAVRGSDRGSAARKHTKRAAQSILRNDDGGHHEPTHADGGNGILNGLTQTEKEAASAGASLAQQIATARRQTKTPSSDAQAEAGNYPKGKVRLHGLTIAIENGKGSTRSGTDPNGKAWSVKLQHDYGYIHRTTGKDGDHVDVFIGPDPDVEAVWIVNQFIDGKFDEHKCLLGFKGKEAARAGYLANYAEGWQGLESLVGMTMEQFKDWLARGDTTKPVKPFTVKQAAATNWANRVDDLMRRRDPDGISTQQWDVAMRATPVRYDMNVNPVANVLSHVQKVQTHGKKQVAQQANYDRLLNAADPDRAIRQLQATLAEASSDGMVPGRYMGGAVT